MEDVTPLFHYTPQVKLRMGKPQRHLEEFYLQQADIGEVM